MKEFLPGQDSGSGTRRTNMQKYSEMSKEQLQALKKELDQQYAEIKAQGLALDMSRGKPSVDQLNISMVTMVLWMVFRKPNVFSERFPK